MHKGNENLDVCAYGGSGQSPGSSLDVCAYGGSGISPPSVKLCQNINVKLCQDINVKFHDNSVWVFIPRLNCLGIFTYSCASTGVLGIFTYSQSSTGVLGINAYDTYTNWHRYSYLGINAYDTCADCHRYEYPCASHSTVIGINTYFFPIGIFAYSTGVLRRKREP